VIPRLIQDQLQEIYDLELHHQVDDYLITDQLIASSIESNSESRQIDEKLLVFEESDNLNVSLYLAEELLLSLERNNPFQNLNTENLNDYCTALEGVSHFIYLTWNATHDRPVSQLELELQAEVDKFVSIIHLSRTQGISLQWQAISKHLFTNCSFDPLLAPHELVRYQTASDHAHHFCNQLGVHYDGSNNHAQINQDAVRRELCRFYRKRHLEKLSHCNEHGVISGP